MDLDRELKKTVAHENDGDTNCDKCSWYSHQRFGKRTRGLQQVMGPAEEIMEVSGAGYYFTEMRPNIKFGKPSS